MDSFGTGRVACFGLSFGGVDFGGGVDALGATLLSSPGLNLGDSSPALPSSSASEWTADALCSRLSSGIACMPSLFEPICDATTCGLVVSSFSSSADSCEAYLFFSVWLLLLLAKSSTLIAGNCAVPFLPPAGVPDLPLYMLVWEFSDSSSICPIVWLARPWNASSF